MKIYQRISLIVILTTITLNVVISSFDFQNENNQKSLKIQVNALRGSTDIENRLFDRQNKYSTLSVNAPQENKASSYPQIQINPKIQGKPPVDWDYDLFGRRKNITIDHTKFDLETEVIRLRPIGQGSITMFDGAVNGSTPPNYYKHVDDEPNHDGDFSYIYHSSTSEEYDLFIVNNTQLPNSGVILKVSIVSWTRVVSGLGAEVWNYVKSGLTIKNGTTHVIPTSDTSYFEFFDEWSSNPDTGTSWTWDDISNLEIGTGGKLGAVELLILTQVYAFVTFTYSAELTLFDFPLLVELNDTDLHRDVQPDGDDIIFTLHSSGQKLNHEIELFDQTGNDTHAHLIAWITIPSLSLIEDTIITMYYGNTTIASQESAEGTWDKNYLAVHHLNQSPMGTIYDSTSNNADGDTTGSMTFNDLVDAWIAMGFGLDGINDGVNGSNSISLTNFTFSAWFKQGSVSTGWRTIIALGENRQVVLNDSILTFYNGTGYNFGNTIPTGGWHYIVFTYNGTELKAYIDGFQNGSQTISLGAVNDRFRIGFVNYTSGYFNGTLDEVRISNISRSPTWIKSEYNNQINPESFLIVGNESEWLAPIVLDFNATESGDGSVTFWANVTDWDNSVDNVNITVNGIEYKMTFNDTSKLWEYINDTANYGDYFTYLISNATDSVKNNMTEATQEQLITLTHDIITPNVDLIGFEDFKGSNGTFIAKVSDNWGEIETVIVNITEVNSNPRNDLWAIMKFNGSVFINDSIFLEMNSNFKYVITVNDTAGNSFTTSEYTDIEPNHSPLALDLTLSRDPIDHYVTPILSNSTLYLNYTYFDPDGDDENSTMIRWYKNGDLQAGYNNETSIPSIATKKREVWYYTIIVSDGNRSSDIYSYREITIENTPPQLSDLTYKFEDNSQVKGFRTNQFFVEDENIQIDFAFTDYDLDDGESRIQWFRIFEDDNWMEMKVYENATMIPWSATNPGEYWVCNVISYDGTDSGNSLNSIIYIESRPVVNWFDPEVVPVVENVPTSEGKYILTVQATNYLHELDEVKFEIWSNNTKIDAILGKPDNNNNWSISLEIDSTMRAYLGKSITVYVSATSIFLSNGSDQEFEIFTDFNSSFILEDLSPPRVASAYHSFDDDQNPSSISFFAEIHEFGSNISEVTLYYNFNPYESTGGTGTILYQSSDLEMQSVEMELLETLEDGIYLYGITLPFDPGGKSREIIFQIYTKDGQGNGDILWNPDFTNIPERYVYRSPALPPLVLLFAIILIILMFVGSIFYVKFIRKPEMIGLDKDLVIKTIEEISELEVSNTIDNYIIGIVLSFFDQNDGPIPLVVEPPLLKGKIFELIKISDRSFSTTGFIKKFDVETSVSFEFEFEDGEYIKTLTYGFSLPHPEARGSMENFTFNVLVIPEIFPLVIQFSEYFASRIKKIHHLMEKRADQKEIIYEEIVKFRQFITAIILSYEKIYGTTELLMGTNEFYSA